MPGFRKVSTEIEVSEKKAKDIKGSQRKYNKKVEDLKACCDNFVNSFLNDRNEFNKVAGVYYGTPKSWQKKFGKAFEEPMKANKSLSRTSKILHQMYKKLGEFKNEEMFNSSNIGKYKEVFNFEEKKAKINKKGEDLIKRSAIDNPIIVEFFKGKEKNTTTFTNISGLLSKMQKGTSKKNSNPASNENIEQQLLKIRYGTNMRKDNSISSENMDQQSTKSKRAKAKTSLFSWRKK